MTATEKKKAQKLEAVLSQNNLRLLLVKTWDACSNGTTLDQNLALIPAHWRAFKAIKRTTVMNVTVKYYYTGCVPTKEKLGKL